MSDEHADLSPYDARACLGDPACWAHYAIYRVAFYPHGGVSECGISQDDRLIAVLGSPLRPGYRAPPWESDDCPELVSVRDWRPPLITFDPPAPPATMRELLAELWRRLRGWPYWMFLPPTILLLVGWLIGGFEAR